MEILVYIGAAVMVVLAVLAYRYWQSTAAYARRVRESHYQQVQKPLLVSPPTHRAPIEGAKPSAATTNESTEPPPKATDETSGKEEPSTTDGPEPLLAEVSDESVESASEATDGPAAGTPPEPPTPPLPTESIETPEVAAPNAEDRPVEELAPVALTSSPGEPTASIGQMLKELDEQLASLPSGIELIDLPILERRRVAARREELLSDRIRLLEQKKRGIHRRRRRSRDPHSAT